MSNKKKPVLALAFLLVVLSGFCRSFKAEAAAAVSSEVKTVDGQPKLFVDGKESDVMATDVYYYAGESSNVIPAYGSDGWLDRMKELIDSAKQNGTGIVMPRIWWSEVDKATARSSDPVKYYDFSGLDQLMDYAAKQDVRVMINLEVHNFIPDWWKKENNFPPYDSGKTCEYCETDSYAYVYDNPSIGSDIIERDFGTFLKAVISRYKNHPALIGWVSGIGATGEDNYGPSYIKIAGNNSGQGTVEQKPLRFTDYSPFFQKTFRSWLKDKYKTDAALQAAWSDKSVTLGSVGVPPAKELVKDATYQGPFPEESQFRVTGIGTDILTTKGKDFYDFRTAMSNSSRDFYIDLFKSADSKHILVLNSGSSFAFKNSRLDGVISNENLCWDCQADHMRQDQLSRMIDGVVSAKQYGKLWFFGMENGSGLAQASSGQIPFVTAVGKEVKCVGGQFGYVSDLAPGKNLYPDWSSSGAQKAVREIADYAPASGCQCDTIKDLWQSNGCDSGGPSGCQMISRAYKEYCQGSGYPPVTNLPTGPDCASKVCLGNSCWNGTQYIEGQKTQGCATGSAQASPSSITPISENPPQEVSYITWASNNASKTDAGCTGPTYIAKGGWYNNTADCVANKSCPDQKGYPAWFHVGTSGTEICTFYPTNASDNLPGTPYSATIQVLGKAKCGNNILEEGEKCDYNPTASNTNTSYVPCPQGQTCQDCQCTAATATTPVCQPDDPSCADKTCNDVYCFDGCNYQKGTQSCTGRK